MNDNDKLIAAYEIDIQFPDVNGMEHLDMLLTRSRIACSESSLSKEQRQRLEAADRRLACQASRFYEAIHQIADLSIWRKNEGVSPSEWWWYLDVLAFVPLPNMHATSTVQIESTSRVEQYQE